jgi:hypothetical protein
MLAFPRQNYFTELYSLPLSLPDNQSLSFGGPARQGQRPWVHGLPVGFAPREAPMDRAITGSAILSKIVVDWQSWVMSGTNAGSLSVDTNIVVTYNTPEAEQNQGSANEQVGAPSGTAEEEAF